MFYRVLFGVHGCNGVEDPKELLHHRRRLKRPKNLKPYYYPFNFNYHFMTSNHQLWLGELYGLLAICLLSRNRDSTRYYLIKIQKSNLKKPMV